MKENLKKIFKNKALNFAAILGSIATCAFGTSCVGVTRYYGPNGEVYEYSDVGERVAMMNATANLMNAGANVVSAAGGVAVPIVDMSLKYSTLNKIDHRHEKTARMAIQSGAGALAAQRRAAGNGASSYGVSGYGAPGYGVSNYGLSSSATTLYVGPNSTVNPTAGTHLGNTLDGTTGYYRNYRTNGR